MMNWPRRSPDRVLIKGSPGKETAETPRHVIPAKAGIQRRHPVLGQGLNEDETSLTHEAGVGWAQLHRAHRFLALEYGWTVGTMKLCPPTPVHEVS